MNLAAFSKWLHAVANRLLGPADQMHDDLVNEGATAMWRAYEKTADFEYEGQRISYAIKSAENRMKNLAWGTGQPLGHEAMRGSQPAKEVAILDNDDLDETFREKITASPADVAELAMFAYHSGKLGEILGQLTPAQLSAARAIMADVKMTKNELNQWYKARDRLKIDLEFLRDYY